MSPLLASIWMPDGATMKLVAPELILIATIVAVLLAPLLAVRNSRTTAMIALVGCVLCAVSAFWTNGLIAPGGQEIFGVTHADGSTVPGMLLVDGLSSFFRMFLMVFLAAIIGMWLMFDAERERNAPEFFTLLLTSALGMALMVSTNNLLMMIIAIEMASLPSYGLAGFDKTRRIAAEASVKYAVFGAATSGFMIYGVSLLFGMTGTLHIPSMVAALAGMESISPVIGFALLAIFAGIGFKISAVPFHYWCPDVFQGASLAVATWLSVVSKAAGLILLLRLVSAFAGQAVPGTAFNETLLPIISYGIGFFACLTCTFANLAAYRQRNIRRMFAYSSIAHAGYMLMAGAIVIQVQGYQSAMSAVVAYVLIYMFMNLGAFLTLGLVSADTGSEDITAFSGLGWRDGVVAASLTACLISLVGLPPLGGFFVKWWLLAALSGAAQSQAAPFSGLSVLLWTLIVVAVLNTAISLYYYARLVWQMYFVPGEGGPLKAPLVGKITVAVCAIVLLLTGTIWVGALKKRADQYVSQMYNATAHVQQAAPVRDVASLDGNSP